VRVISGSARGRRLLAVPGTGTRPITDRVKEALFNILRARVEGSTWLDLFAGTGSVGIEALSRGAEHVVFVDNSRKAIDTVRRNLELTGLADQATVRLYDAFRYLRQAEEGAAFDLIYVAPPQYKDLWAKALLLLDERPLLAPKGLIVVQIHPREYRSLALRQLRQVEERRYGDTALYFYALAGPDASEEQAVEEAEA
jgi:16S rRNA (guanine(966)-N(2))-methyltransferase RsmD